MENVRKHRGMKLVTTGTRRNYLVLEPNYHTIKSFSENSLAVEMRKTWILVMYQFWHDYEKTEYGEKAKFSYMDIDSVKEGYKYFCWHCKRCWKKIWYLRLRISQVIKKKKTDVRRLKKSNEEFIKSNKVILKSQEIFISEKLNVFIEEVHRVALRANDNIRIQSIDPMETYA